MITFCGLCRVFWGAGFRYLLKKFVSTDVGRQVHSKRGCCRNMQLCGTSTADVTCQTRSLWAQQRWQSLTGLVVS